MKLSHNEIARALRVQLRLVGVDPTPFDGEIYDIARNYSGSDRAYLAHARRRIIAVAFGPGRRAM